MVLEASSQRDEGTRTVSGSSHAGYGTIDVKAIALGLPAYNYYASSVTAVVLSTEWFPAASAENIAAVLVHEVTHARLDQAGHRSYAENRERHEKIFRGKTAQPTVGSVGRFIHMPFENTQSLLRVAGGRRKPGLPGKG